MLEDFESDQKLIEEFLEEEINSEPEAEGPEDERIEEIGR
jgi:hypothetical protein